MSTEEEESADFARYILEGGNDMVGEVKLHLCRHMLAYVCISHALLVRGSIAVHSRTVYAIRNKRYEQMFKEMHSLPMLIIHGLPKPVRFLKPFATPRSHNASDTIRCSKPEPTSCSGTKSNSPLRASPARQPIIQPSSHKKHALISHSSDKRQSIPSPTWNLRPIHRLLLLLRHLRHRRLPWLHRSALQLRQVLKPRMSQRLAGTDPHLRPQLQHLAQQIQSQRIHLRQNRMQALGREVVEIRLVFRKLADARPGALGWRAHETEDFLELIVVGRTGKKRPARVHLRHDAAGGPDVDAGIVGAGAEEDVWRPVPQRHDLVGEGIDGDAEGAGKAEVGELELAFGVDEEVLGL
jgi:hypothetical protein